MEATDLNPGVAGSLDFQVRRDNLRRHRLVPTADPGDPAPGQALLRIVRFALTSNNITYAVFGEEMDYWRFFPAPEGWGRIPVWGFAEVIASRAESLTVGERLFGFLPISTHLAVAPERTSAAAFVDGAAHRRPLHGVYNQYLRCAADPGYRVEHEDLQMLLRPLFMTSFLIDDFLADNGFFSARTVVLSSASSKTAFGLAHLLHRNRDCEVIGLTSAGNTDFVNALGCYDQVVDYDHIRSLASDTPAVYVDMAGNAGVRSAVHHHFGENLKYSCAVGGAHWDQRGAPGKLPGAAPTFFFAPAQVNKRAREWGAGGVQARFATAWAGFLEPVGGWIRVVHSSGPPAIEKTYLAMLNGRVAPAEGHVMSL